MNRRTPLQQFLIILNFTLILGVIAIGIDIMVFQNTLTGQKNTVAQVEEFIEEKKVSTPVPTPTNAPPPIPVTKPRKIEIPTIGVYADIIDVGVTPDNAMEVPDDGSKVGWFYPGAKPGETGGAILTAHYDTNTGKPAIFYNLRQVNPGDLIYITMEDGEELLFQVQNVVSQPVRAFPTELVYGEFNSKELILITCDGVWNPLERSYSKRLAVFATLWQNRTL